MLYNYSFKRRFDPEKFPLLHCLRNLQNYVNKKSDAPDDTFGDDIRDDLCVLSLLSKVLQFDIVNLFI